MSAWRLATGLLMCASATITTLSCRSEERRYEIVPEARGGGPPPVASVPELMTPGEPLTPPLRADNALTSLAIDGRKPAVLSLPIGATAKRPILVAVHGRDDYPQPLCEMWRGIVNDRAFVVCPTGIPSQSLPGAYTYASHDALADEIDDAVSALRAKYPEHADDGPLVYAGFSLGSYQGVSVVNKDPSKTPRVILIEGGHDRWSEDRIRSFADGGGQRVLFVSGQEINEQRSQRVAKELETAGLGARAVSAEGAGHVYTGEVRDRIAEAFDWVVDGDERWKK